MDSTNKNNEHINQILSDLNIILPDSKEMDRYLSDLEHRFKEVMQVQGHINPMIFLLVTEIDKSKEKNNSYKNPEKITLPLPTKDFDTDEVREKTIMEAGKRWGTINPKIPLAAFIALNLSATRNEGTTSSSDNENSEDFFIGGVTPSGISNEVLLKILRTGDKVTIEEFQRKNAVDTIEMNLNSINPILGAFYNGYIKGLKEKHQKKFGPGDQAPDDKDADFSH